MVIYEKKRFPSRMDNMGRKMHNLSLILNLSKWARERGLDSTAKGTETGLSTSTLTICPSSGRVRHMYASSMFAWHAQRLPNIELRRGYPLAAVRRRYHIFNRGLGRGSKEPIHTSRSIYRLLGLTNKLGQFSFCEVWYDSR